MCIVQLFFAFRCGYSKREHCAAAQSFPPPLDKTIYYQNGEDSYGEFLRVLWDKLR